MSSWIRRSVFLWLSRSGMGIGREFAEFRENVLHSPQGKKLTREKKFLGSFFSQGVKLIFRRSEATYLPQHRFRFLLYACAVAPLPLWLQAQSVNMSLMSRIVQRGESFDESGLISDFFTFSNSHAWRYLTLKFSWSVLRCGCTLLKPLVLWTVGSLRLLICHFA